MQSSKPTDRRLLVPMLNRRFVIVSGSPGAGKTTVGAALARAFELPFISKDQIKETLFDALHALPGDLEYSRRLSGAAMEVLWTLAAACPSAVLEANFRPHSADERGRLLALQPAIEVYCDCGAEEAARRFAARARAGLHPAHPLTELSAEMRAEYDRPVGFGTVIRVDTSRPVDIATVVARIEAAWAAQTDSGATAAEPGAS
jgi:predicted kinase